MKLGITKRQDETGREYRTRWMREWREANPSTKNDSQYKWRNANPDKFKKSHATWLKKKIESDPEYYRNKQRKFNRLPDPTRPCPEHCEACGEIEQRTHKETGVRFSLSLDHCHSTGVFRGWLCGICNTTLGRYKDDYERINGIAKYAETYISSRN